MRVEILRGEHADRLLGEPSFVAEWSALCNQCPWATPFQSPAFAVTWYRVYRRHADPVLVLSRENGRLQSLLPLAHFPARSRLVVAGSWHAEYHAWLSPPRFGDAFPAAALLTLRRQFPSLTISFNFLPPKAPIAWLQERPFRRLCLVEPRRRPLMCFGNGAEVAASLAKSSNKSRLKRLEKLGPIQFQRITDPVEFEAHFDQIIRFYDARRLAVTGSAPFRNDLDKRAFHLAMLEQPGLLHATVMKVGGRLASAHLGACAKHEVQLGLIAHDPDLERHSPGKFHILLLAKMLMQEGYSQLDLTAGGDPYKERFANAWDQVHSLRAFPSSLAKTRAAVATRLEQAARRSLDVLHITPARVRRFINSIKRLHTAPALESKSASPATTSRQCAP